MKWTYDDMYKWYTKQHMIHDSSDEVLVIMYDSKKPSKKDAHMLEPFVKRNIKYVGKAPVQDKRLYPNGVFLVYDDNASKKKWLYFVYPTRENNNILANHFTFCHDISDKRKPCHFHSTLYTTVVSVEGTRFRQDHEKDFMSDTLQFPEDEGAIFVKHPESKPFLLKTIQHPWKSEQVGGGRKPSQIQTPAHHIRNGEFCRQWSEYGVKALMCFGIRVGNTYVWNMHFEEKGRRPAATLRPAVRIETPVYQDAEMYETHIMSELSQKMPFIL